MGSLTRMRVAPRSGSFRASSTSVSVSPVRPGLYTSPAWNAPPALVIAASGRVLPDLASLMGTLAERHAELVAISDDAGVLSRARVGLRLPTGIPEWLSPLAAVLPGQLFAVALARTRGLDPDRPRGLSKVTETL